MTSLRTSFTPALGTAKVRCQMPLLLRKSLLFYRPGGDQAATVDLIWTTPARWGRLPASADSTWSVLGVGPFVLAVRFSL
jgi:hypothetical protein